MRLEPRVVRRFAVVVGVRGVGRGKEFLCATVTSALGAFAVPVQDLPAYTRTRPGL